MKTILYKFLFILFIATPSLIIANDGTFKGKYTKQKTLNKEFKVTKNALLKIKNDYGNLDITAWDKDQISIQITIKVNGNDEEKVIRKLKDIDVEFDTSSTMVSATTIFHKRNQSWWDKFSNGNNNTHMEINYIIKMPITNNIDLNNDYGSITLDKIKGNTRISCDYGQLILGELLGNQNEIRFDYTRNSTIEYLSKGSIYADYSNFNLRKADEVHLVADYTKSRIGAIKKLNYKCDYGSLKVENVGVFVGRGDYLTTELQNLHFQLDVIADYGSIKVMNLQSTVKNVNLRTDYVRIALGYIPSLEFDFNIKGSYASITLDDQITVLKKKRDGSDKNYQGYNNTQNSGNAINIISSYGSIKLLKN